MEEFLQVGIITSPHGLKGEVKVFPTTDDPKRFLELKTVLMEYVDSQTGKEKVELQITQVKFFKRMAILKFKGYDHINEVEAWRKKPLYVTREQAVACEEDEFFIADLIGLKVATKEGEALGRLIEVLQTGANDVYIIVKPGEKKELLVPAIKECILDIDMKEREMTIHLPEGLREE